MVGARFPAGKGWLFASSLLPMGINLKLQSAPSRKREPGWVGQAEKIFSSPTQNVSSPVIVLKNL